MPDDLLPLVNAWALILVGALAVVLLAIFMARSWGRIYQRRRYDGGRYVREHEREAARKARRWQRQVIKLQERARRSEIA